VWGGEEVVVGGENAEMVEVICGGGVVAALELELAVVIEDVELLEAELEERWRSVWDRGLGWDGVYIVMFFEIHQVLVLVLTKGLGDFRIVDDIEHCLSFLL
jgi:hypothetical protein